MVCADLRDIESYCIKQNAKDCSPIKNEEITEEIEKKFKKTILNELDSFFGGFMRSIQWHKNSEHFHDKDTKDIFKERHRMEYEMMHEYKNRSIDNRMSKTKVLGYLRDNKNIFMNDYPNIKKWKEKYLFAKEDIFKNILDQEKKYLQELIILEDRTKLFTIEFNLKNKTTVKWGAYKTKEEAEIVYNKVDNYFKKTFSHFYKNLDNQEIYSL